MLIRPAKLSDANQMYDILLELMKVEDKSASKVGSDWKKYRTKKSNFKSLAIKDIKADIKDKKKRYIVAEHNNKIIGYCLGSIFPKKNYFFVPQKIAYLNAIAIKSDYRGKGIATLLHNDMLNYFKKQKCYSVSLEVFHSNDAVNIYKHWNYKPAVLKMIKKL